MSDETRRATEFERRLESLGRSDSVPREAEGIEDLALRVRQSLAPPAPSPAFIASARRQLIHRLPRGTGEPRSRPAFGVVRRLAFAAASILVAFTLGTASVAYAAQEAIPGDSLYGIKRGIESARWSLTDDPRSQAALLSDIAAERMREVQGLADAGRDSLLTPTLEDYEQTLDHLQSVADTLADSTRTQVLALATARVQQHQQVLERLLDQVPSQARPAIEHAIERSFHSQQALEALQQGQRPSDLAPGQNKTKESGPNRTPGPRGTKTKP